MSSTAFSAEIRPDPFLRRIVLASGTGLTLLGSFLILVLPVHPVLWLAGSIAWLVLAAFELRGLRRAWRICHVIRFHADGSVVVLSPGQDWRPARLLPGGILLRRAGWIRLLLVSPGGKKRVLGELIRGDSRRSADWRRLQVIWRHIGA